MKRIIAIILTLLILIPYFSIGTFAAYENTYVNTGDQRTDIIGVAKTQIGNDTGSKYTFGAGNVSWCAYFVVWCARQANISSSIIKTSGFADADDLGVTYKGRDAGRTVEISYTPKAGDLIFFDWSSNGYTTKSPASSYGDHVGIVEYVESGYVHTIEGNSGSSHIVRRYSYKLTSSEIKGYGIPNYTSTNHTISYNANGGSGSISSKTVKSGGTFTISSNSFTKTGYTFKGWNVKRSADSKWYVKGQGWFTESEISVNGYEKSLYSSGKEYTLDNSWTKGLSGSTTYTFYAQWEVNTLSVYYNTNGGTISSDTYKLSSNVVYNISDGSKYTHKWTYNVAKEKGLVNAATFGLSRAGYKFSGWGTSASGGTVYTETDNTIKPTDLNSNIKNGSCSITLYAQWTPNTLSVYYNANGGTISSDKYKLNSNIVYNISDNTKAVQSWIYNNTKEKGLTNEKSFGISRTGYTFKGWGTTASGGTIFDADDVTLKPTDINANIKNGSCSTTLYAQWEPNTLSVYFNANGGTISSDKYKLNSNIVYNISDDTKAIQSWTYNNTKSKGLTNEKSFGISRTGYTFKGWGTTASGGTIFDADDVTLMPTDINANIKNGSCSTTLYAQWEPVIFIKKDDSKITVQDGFIYDSSIIGMTSDELMLQFTNTNIVISKPMDRISTGITIHIEDEKGQIYDELTVVIFGDVNSDGVYDGTDAMIVNCIANGMLTKEQVGEAVYMAADCNHDGVIDNLDVELLQQAGVLLASIGQNKTQEELQTSSAYVEYLNLVDQNPVNEKYNTDNEIIPSYSKQPIEFIADFFAFIKNLLNLFKTIFA